VVKSNGKIALLDFGSVGYIDDRMRDKIRLFYFSISRENVSKATEIFLDICNVSESTISKGSLEQDFREFLDFQRLKRNGYQIDDGMNQTLIAVALKHGFAPPPMFILLERALLEVEDVTRELSPNFDFNSVLGPTLEEIIKDKVSHAADPIGAIQTAQDYKMLAAKGPKKVYSILEKIESDSLTVKVDPSVFEDFRRDIWRIMGIMGVSIIAMALLFLIMVARISFQIPVIQMSVTAVPIVLIWLISVWWIYRRWKGPK